MVFDEYKQRLLEEELREKLPPNQIKVDLETGVATYYDYHGVTFRDRKEEQAYARDYVARIIAEKAGFPIRVTSEWDGNGHCGAHFERISLEPPE